MADKNIFKLEGKSQEQVKEAFLELNIEMVQFHGGWRGSTDDGNRRDAFQSE